MEVMKAVKGHLSFCVCFKVEVGFCEHVSSSFRHLLKIRVNFSTLR